MRFYQVDFNEVDYDQYDAFIVVAKNRREAIKHLKEQHSREPYGDVDWKNGYTVKLIRADKYKNAEIILGSFNAG